MCFFEMYFRTSYLNFKFCVLPRCVICYLSLFSSKLNSWNLWQGIFFFNNWTHSARIVIKLSLGLIFLCYFIVDIRDEEFNDTVIDEPELEPLPGKEEEYIDDLVAHFNEQDIHDDIGDAVSVVFIVYF